MRALLAGVLMALCSSLGTALANPVLIVAIGADNVSGRGIGRHNTGGVSPYEAFPAQLEALLRAQGVDARVSNAGVGGDTTEGMLARLDQAVPESTRLVILDRANGNDKKAGEKDHQKQTLNEIEERLRVRHIALIVLPHWDEIPGAIENRDFDGHHFTAEGHAAIARYLLPKVTAELTRPSSQ